MLHACEGREKLARGRQPWDLPLGIAQTGFDMPSAWPNVRQVIHRKRIRECKSGRFEEHRSRVSQDSRTMSLGALATACPGPVGGFRAQLGGYHQATDHLPDPAELLIVADLCAELLESLQTGQGSLSTSSCTTPVVKSRRERICRPTGTASEPIRGCEPRGRKPQW